MLNKVIEAIKNSDLAKGNPAHEKEAIEEATISWNNGFDALEDGKVIYCKGDRVLVKKGSKVILQDMQRDNWRINCGKLIGDVKAIVKEIEIPENEKGKYLAQAIITRFYTIPKM